MLNACAEAGVQLMDGTMWMHCARTPLMQEALGTVGELRDVTSNFSFYGAECGARMHQRCMAHDARGM